MNLQELQTIASLRLPLRLIVFNNGGYASIRNTQRNYFEGRYVGSGPSSKLEMPDFVALAKTFGWDAFRLASHPHPLVADKIAPVVVNGVRETQNRAG